MQRSVGREKGVATVSLDLGTGTARVWFTPGSTVEPASLWEAVKKAGFTPLSVKSQGKFFRGR